MKTSQSVLSLKKSLLAAETFLGSPNAPCAPASNAALIKGFRWGWMGLGVGALGSKNLVDFNLVDMEVNTARTWPEVKNTNTWGGQTWLNYQTSAWTIKESRGFTRRFTRGLTIKREGLTGLNHPEMRDQWPKQLPHTSHEGVSSWIDPILNHRFQEGIS